MSIARIRPKKVYHYCVSRPKNENVVIISEKEYNEMAKAKSKKE